MSSLPVLVAPHPLLKAVSSPVQVVDRSIQTLLKDMVETMYKEVGMGLAAPQVGISLRVIVIDMDYEVHDASTRNPRKFINPEITWISDEDISYKEGCLSIPEHYADVVRPRALKLKYLDEFGTPQTLEAEDLFAVCIQHEIDHLDGILFIDHLSNVKRTIILRKLLREQKLKEEM